jgi:hypothetical protein
MRRPDAASPRKMLRQAKCTDRGEVQWLLIGSFFETRYLIGLGAFGTLNDVELNFVALFQALIALALN